MTSDSSRSAAHRSARRPDRRASGLFAGGLVLIALARSGAHPRMLARAWPSR